MFQGQRAGYSVRNTNHKKEEVSIIDQEVEATREYLGEDEADHHITTEERQLRTRQRRKIRKRSSR